MGKELKVKSGVKEDRDGKKEELNKNPLLSRLRSDFLNCFPNPLPMTSAATEDPEHRVTHRLRN